jgi:polysaccharide transporter, PST family
LKKYIDKVKNRPTLVVVIKNIGWLFFDRVLRMGVGMYVTLCIARYLGSSQFGTFNYATAFATIFLPVATLGLDVTVVHRLVNNTSSKGRILSTVFWLRCLGSLLSILLAVCGIFVFRHNDSITILLVAVLAVAGIFQPFDTIDIWFQSQLQSKYTVFAKNTAFILSALYRVILIQNQAPLMAFAVAGLIEAGLGALGLAILFKIKGNSTRFLEWDSSLAKKLIKEGFPLILSGLSVMIYVKIDQVMLGEMIGENAVGIYSAAARISEVWYFIPVAVASSVSPAIYAAKKIGEGVYYERIKHFIRSMFLMSIVIAVPMTFLSGYVIEALFGSEYIEAGPILSIHIWAAVFVFTGVATSPWFVAEELTSLSFQRTFLGCVTNVILNLLLIPYYQGIGSAIATVVSYAMSGFFAHVIYPSTRKLFLIQLKALLIFV